MKSTVWIRRNGQADMRVIVRAAIKEARLSQSAAAKKAGIKYTTLIGFLGNNSWFKREDAQALADALGLALDELVGASIFKDQTDRYEEFEHRPADDERDREWNARRAAAEALEAERRAEVAAGKTRALCCECGALRTCMASRYRWEPSDQYRANDGHRVIERLKCFTCDEVTRHAVILTRGDVNGAEDLDRRPTQFALAQREREAFIARLREFNVLVTYRRGWTSKKKGGYYSSGYEFNTNTMQWEISLDENMPPRLHVAMLQHYWDRITRDEHGGVDWDPRDGVWCQPSREDWADAADELMKDIERFMHVERSKLVLELRDQAQASETRSQTQDR